VIGGLFAGASAAAPAVQVATAHSTSLGTFLVSASRTLYHDSAEARNTVKCTGVCAKEWRPLLLTAGAKPVAAAGVSAALLGTVKRPDGKVQVTYRGLPLYVYAGDSKSGDVNGQGVAGLWHAVAPSGAIITKSISSGSSGGGGSTGSGGGGTVTGPGGGYGATTDPCVINPNANGCGM
jgi:predicted lipoprotein with Yx(FWY)xxD motif